LAYWIKGEILDVIAFQESLQHRQQVTTNLQKTNSKKQSLMQELDKLIGGKKSLKTFFKSKSELETYQGNLEKQIQ
jgi:hypothetical protein